MTMRDKEAMPFLNSAAEAMTGVIPMPGVSKDEENYDTLRAVYLLLKDGLDQLDKWSAFDLQQTDNLNLKQQVKAHQLAYDLIAPLFESVKSAMEMVNQKYKER